MSGGERFGIFGSRAIVTCTCSSAITPRTQAAISAGSSPASMRQSIWAVASGGMTLLFSLPRSIVTANVVRTIAAYWRFDTNRSRNAGSRRLLVRSSYPAPLSADISPETREKNSWTSGRTRGGRSASSSRLSARTSRFGAVSGHGIEPWPGSPRAVSTRASPVFSEITMAPSGALRLGCVWIAASSEIAYSAPASHSRRRSAMNWAPNSLPTSSWPGTRDRA